MKQYVIIVLLLQLLSGCSSDKPGYSYDYVKIVTFRDADSGNAYNKGKGLWAYLYYRPGIDSVVFRKGHRLSEDSAEFTTYEGQFENRHYADTLSMLIDLLKRHKSEELYNIYDSIYGAYCGPDFSAEYSINGKPHFISFTISNDTIGKFVHFFSHISQMRWNKKIIHNNYINETEETVHMLKGLGTYDSIIYTPPYIPLPCEKGIKMELLYGKWRTIGNKYNNANLTYKTNIIEKNGSWAVDFFYEGKLEPRNFYKIISISADNTITLKSNFGTRTLKVLNLTENCFEYKFEDSDYSWRLDRMR